MKTIESVKKIEVIMGVFTVVARYALATFTSLFWESFLI